MGKIFKNNRIIKVSEVDSTNAYTAKLLDELNEGSIIWADFQTSGRGQGNNSWESEKGKNLTFSVVLYPTFLKAVNQFYLSKAISLAVSDFLSLYTKKVTIKWPNDIYIGGKKVAGILIENAIERDFIRSSIIGIGINIHQLEFISNAPNPISLSQVTGDEYNLEELLDIFIHILEYRYKMLKDSEFTSINENYLEVLFRRNEPAKFISNNALFTGVINHVEDNGELVIVDTFGETHKFLHKEVEFVL